MRHFVSKTCNGAICGMCYREGVPARPATHKIGEEIPHDDPSQGLRHNYTQDVCCMHFKKVMGHAVHCPHSLTEKIVS